jgi:hypothetical protein
MILGKTVIEYNGDSEGAQAVKMIWKRISRYLAL